MGENFLCFINLIFFFSFFNVKPTVQVEYQLAADISHTRFNVKPTVQVQYQLAADITHTHIYVCLYVFILYFLFQLWPV